MPQVKGEHRGALLQFLEARGISHEKGTSHAVDLKPTQAEFSREKVDRFKETGPKGERSVLISSDGHVLDGHHQWKAMAEMGEDIPVIRLNAPIRELLAAVEAFPSVQRSEGADNLDALRAAAVGDFKGAMADLADIVSKHTRASMLPENTPGLMPTLVKLFDAAIRIVGTDLKKATALVQAELKKNKALAKVWNRIAPDTYRKAALQALDAMQGQPKQASLFDSVEEAGAALQGDLFSQPEPAAPSAPAAAMIDSNLLTRLVVVAHRFAVRIAITQSGPNRIGITAHPRKADSECNMTRHATTNELRELLDKLDQWEEWSDET
jgi:hypothetical protein